MSTYVVSVDRLPAALRTTRRALRLTQAQFAEKAGLSPGAIGRIEIGDLSAVSTETATRLAELIAAMAVEVAS